MAFVVLGLAVLCGLGSLVCFILVIIKMFQNGQTGMAIASILLIWCIGGLIAFVVGWQNHAKWNIKNVMLIWTGCIIGSIVLNVLANVVQ